jgi:hypothetical protein
MYTGLQQQHEQNDHCAHRQEFQFETDELHSLWLLTEK